MTTPTRPYNAIAGPIGAEYPTVRPNGVMIIGEAPGRNEAILKRPFVGPAGQLLDTLLQNANIDRQATLICNVFRWQPTWSIDAAGKRRNNDIESFFTSDLTVACTDIPPYNGRSLHQSHREDINFLTSLIHGQNPQRIIALGTIALWALTGKTTMRDVRGKAVQTPLSPAPVFPSWHPAYALHKKDPAISADILADIVRATAP
jgi:DNA polymerase